MSAVTAFFAENAEPLLWLAATLVLVAAEALTVDLVCIWFAVGALAATIAAAFNASLTTQFLLFVLVSGAALIFTRKFVVGVLRVKKVPTNADSVIGMEGMTIEDIDNVAQTGRVSVNGLDWTARSSDGENIPVGTSVSVCAIDGVKLIVAPAAAGIENNNK